MTNCVIGQREHEARHGYLCEGHMQRLSAMLREIEDEAAILSAVPSMQNRTGNRGGTLASHRTPVRLDVLVHTDPRHGIGWAEEEDDTLAAGETLSVLATLHSWARTIREERDLTDSGPVTISGERAILTRHLDWVAAQPWADEFYADLSALIGQLKAANGHRAERPFSSCPSLPGGEQCNGQVWVRDEVQPVWRRYTDRCAQSWEAAPGSAVCDTCGTTWTTPAEKARLQRMVDDLKREMARPRTDDGRRMLTADELVEQGIVSTVANVRVTAHRLGMRAVRGHYDPDVFTRKATA